MIITQPFDMLLDIIRLIEESQSSLFPVRLMNNVTLKQHLFWIWLSTYKIQQISFKMIKYSVSSGYLVNN